MTYTGAASGVPSYVPAVGVVLVVVGAVALVVAYYRASYAKATIDTLKQSNDALTERVRILEDENERCTAERAVLSAENTNLKTYVSGTEAVAALQVLMTGLLDEINRGLIDVKGMIGDQRRRTPRPPATAQSPGHA